MGTRVFQYFPGATVETEAAISHVELASAGDPTAKTRLVYPSIAPAAPALNPITYFVNPDRRMGFDNDDLPLLPNRSLVMTVDDQVVLSFPKTVVDIVITEKWTVAGGKLSMSSAMMRELRGYHENPPDPDVLGWITWQPAEQSTRTYQIQMLSLQVGSDINWIDATEFRPGGGDGTIAGPDGDLGVEFASSGWQDVEVVQKFRLIAEV
jgi:hypothetical protein